MKTRLNYARVAPGVYDAMDALDWNRLSIAARLVPGGYQPGAAS